MRGVTLNRGDILLVDEAQNLTGNVIRDILTRIGGATVIFVGDPYQLDNTRFNSVNYNGVTNLISKLYNPKYSNKIDSVREFRQITSVLGFKNILRSNELDAVMKLYGH
jgi:predicted ribonuclease YlaK